MFAGMLINISFSQIFFNLKTTLQNDQGPQIALTFMDYVYECSVMSDSL